MKLRWPIGFKTLTNRHPGRRRTGACKRRAGAMAHFQRAMMMDVDRAAEAIKDAEIGDFIEDFKQPTLPRHAINGSGCLFG